MRRQSGWRQRLQDYVRVECERPFERSRSDCLTFVGGCVEAMTGVYPWPEYVGQYADLEGLRALCRRNGGDVLKCLQAKAHAYEWPTIDPRFALTGDVALVEGSEGLAINLGGQWIVKSPRGMADYTGEFVRAWKVL